jgi:hypothetical protein
MVIVCPNKLLDMSSHLLPVYLHVEELGRRKMGSTTAVVLQFRLYRLLL